MWVTFKGFNHLPYIFYKFLKSKSMEKRCYLIISALVLVFNLLANENSTIEIDTLNARHLVIEGDSLVLKGEKEYFKEAEKKFKAASKLYQKHKVWEKYFSCELKIVEILAELQSFQLAKMKADSIVEKSRKILGNRNEKEAIAYNLKGVCLIHEGYEKGDKIQFYFERAKSYFVLSSEILKSKYKYHQTLVENLINIGIYFQDGLDSEYDSALVYYRKALRLQYKSTDRDDDKNTAQCFNNIGTIFYHRGEADSAEYYLKKSLKVRKRVLGERHFETALAYQNYGVFLQQFKYEYDSARYFYNKALVIEKDRNPVSLDVLRLYNLIGVNYYGTGNYDKSLNFYDKALVIIKQNKSLEEDEKSGNLVSLYNNIGAVYYKLGQANSAFLYHNEAKRVYGQLNQNKPHTDIVSVNNNIANDYKLQGNYEQALIYYDESLSVARQLIRLNKTSIKTVIPVYINIGETYHQFKKYDKAIEYYDNTLVVLKKLPEPDLYYQGVCYNNLGKVYQDKGEYDKALNYYKMALNGLKEIYNSTHTLIISCLSNIAYLYYLQGDLNKSLKEYQQIFNSVTNDNKLLADFHYNPVAISSIYHKQFLALFHQKAIILEKKYVKENQMQDLIAASSSIKVCDNLLDSIRVYYTQDYEDKLELTKSAKAIYETAIQINYSLYQLTGDDVYSNQAFYYSEKSKGVLLLLLMLDSNAKEFSGIPKDVLEQEQYLRAVKTKLTVTLLNKPQDSIASKGLFKVKQSYNELIKKLEKDFQNYFQNKYNLEIKPISYIQEKMLDKKKAIISYFVGKDIYIFVIQNKKYDILKVSKDFPLTEWVRGLNSGVYGYWLLNKDERTARSFNKHKQEYIEKASDLYTKLFYPLLEQNLPEQIIIIPDEELNLIPFTALLTSKPNENARFGNYPYLLNDYQISYAYSVRLLDEMENKKVNSNQGWIGIAPFTKSENLGLSYSADEVTQIQKLISGMTLLDEAATIKKFKEEVGKYSFIHFATHAEVNSGFPSLSFVSGFSDTLRVADIYNLELNASMVVLNGCETGLGELQRGEGVNSIARAFTYSGAKNITATLWSVKDQSSYLIMVQYYKFLLEGFSKSQALQKSQQAYLSKDIRLNKEENKIVDVERHPYYWAAFISIGDSSSINIRNSLNLYLKWVLFSLLIILVVILWRFLINRNLSNKP